MMPTTDTVRALIVDDEPLARSLLRSMLEEEPDVDVVGECGGAAEAARAVRAGGVDLVFLDVQMPEGDGFSVIEQVGAERMPAVVFVTAYDRYAVRAFEVHALDYLLKPFDEERLAAALGRARRQLVARPLDDLQRRLLAALEELGARRPPSDAEPATPRRRIAVRDRHRTFLQRVEEIDRIEAAGKHVVLHVAGGAAYPVQVALSRLERQLDPAQFVRISRSHIVNVDRIRELQPWFHGEHLLILRDGTRLTTTRGFRAGIERLLGR